VVDHRVSMYLRSLATLFCVRQSSTVHYNGLICNIVLCVCTDHHSRIFNTDVFVFLKSQVQLMIRSLDGRGLVFLISFSKRVFSTVPLVLFAYSDISFIMFMLIYREYHQH